MEGDVFGERGLSILVSGGARLTLFRYPASDRWQLNLSPICHSPMARTSLTTEELSRLVAALSLLLQEDGVEGGVLSGPLCDFCDRIAKHEFTERPTEASHD